MAEPTKATITTESPIAQQSRAMAAPDGVYLGRLEDINGLLRLLAADAIDRYVKVGLGGLPPDGDMEATRKECRSLAEVFAGKDPAYGLVAGDWHPAGLARWLRQNTDVAEADDVAAIETALANLLLEVREGVAQGIAEDWSDAQAAAYLDAILDEYTYLMAGVPMPRPSEQE